MLCGPRCLRYILEQDTGKTITVGEAASMCQTGDGTSPKQLINGFEQLGYIAKLHQDISWGDLEFLAYQNWVVVLWWSVLHGGTPSHPDGHWSVVLDITPRDITIYEPEAGQIARLPRMFFEAHWYDFRTSSKGQRADFHRAALVTERKKS